MLDFWNTSETKSGLEYHEMPISFLDWVLIGVALFVPTAVVLGAVWALVRCVL
jgi:hypothetical protein